MFGAGRLIDEPSRALALVAAAFAVLVSGRLQALAWRLREREGKSRLASNLRDFVNFVAVAVLSAAFVLAGMALPLAVLASGTVGVAQEALRHHAQGRAGHVPVLVGLAMALPAAMFPGAVAGAATWAARLVGA